MNKHGGQFQLQPKLPSVQCLEAKPAKHGTHIFFGTQDLASAMA